MVVNGVGHRGPTFKQASTITPRIFGDWDLAMLTFPYFHNIMSSEVISLPIMTSDFVAKSSVIDVYELDQDDLEFYLQFSAVSLVFYALNETFVSELANRITAMSAASRNASKVKKQLMLQYNRKRQEKITTEIIDIISGLRATEKKKKKSGKKVKYLFDGDGDGDGSPTGSEPVPEFLTNMGDGSVQVDVPSDPLKRDNTNIESSSVSVQATAVPEAICSHDTSVATEERNTIRSDTTEEQPSVQPQICTDQQNKFESSHVKMIDDQKVSGNNNEQNKVLQEPSSSNQETFNYQRSLTPQSSQINQETSPANQDAHISTPHEQYAQQEFPSPYQQGSKSASVQNQQQYSFPHPFHQDPNVTSKDEQPTQQQSLSPYPPGSSNVSQPQSDTFSEKSATLQPTSPSISQSTNKEKGPNSQSPVPTDKSNT